MTCRCRRPGSPSWTSPTTTCAAAGAWTSSRRSRSRRRPPGPSCAASSSARRRRSGVTSPSTGCTSSSMTRRSAPCCARTRSVRSTNGSTGSSRACKGADPVGHNLDRRPLLPGDAGDWAALLAAIQDADKSDQYSSEEDLLEEFGRPGEDFTRGSIAIYDGPTMVGYGVLTSRSEAGPVHDMRHEGGVHPSYRGRGLGAELLAWAEQTAVPLHNDRFPGRPLSLSSGCLSSNAGAVALHEQRGYRPVRWIHSMIRDLSAIIPRAA